MSILAVWYLQKLGEGEEHDAKKKRKEQGIIQTEKEEINSHFHFSEVLD